MPKFEEYVLARLKEMGLNCQAKEGNIEVIGTVRNTILILDNESIELYKKLKQAKRLAYNEKTRIFNINTTIEVPVISHNLYGFGINEEFVFTDNSNNKVIISRASESYSQTVFGTEEYSHYFKRLHLERLQSGTLSRRQFTSLLRKPLTAQYVHKGRKIPSDIEEIAIKNINKCLFHLAVEFNEPISIWTPKERSLTPSRAKSSATSLQIPRCNYNEDLVSYYKVAKSSLFPSQSFLAYYHILEYFFLKIKETKLHQKLMVTINSLTFKSDSSNLDKLISTVRGFDNKNDETEMLSNVISNFVETTELSMFITNFEITQGVKSYTTKRTFLGENIQITNSKDHVLSNVSRSLKHIRNGIVHSSDKYSREERLIPNSDKELIIEEFLPLIKFIAEKVIFGSAKP